MKKILALALSMGALTTVFAQNGYPKDSRDESRGIVYGKPNNQVYDNKNYRNDNYSFSARERDAQIERINREFDFKIMAVKRNRYLRNAEKKREIRMLEKERTEQIWQLNQRFSNQKPQKSYHYNDQNSRNDSRRR